MCAHYYVARCLENRQWGGGVIGCCCNELNFVWFSSLNKNIQCISPHLFKQDTGSGCNLLQLQVCLAHSSKRIRRKECCRSATVANSLRFLSTRQLLTETSREEYPMVRCLPIRESYHVLYAIQGVSIVHKRRKHRARFRREGLHTCA